MLLFRRDLSAAQHSRVVATDASPFGLGVVAALLLTQGVAQSAGGINLPMQSDHAHTLRADRRIPCHEIYDSEHGAH